MRLPRFARTSPAWRGGDRTAGKNRGIAYHLLLRRRLYNRLFMRQRTPIGGLLLEAVEGWRFSLRDGTIAGRRGYQPGVLRMTSTAPNELERPITHESCLQIAAKFANVPQPMLRSQQTVASATGPFGWGSGRWGKDYLCAWYCCRPSGLIVGVYAFPLLVLPRARAAGCAQRVRPHGGNGHFRSHLVGSGR